jgi:serine/threonine protein kinase
MIRGKVCKLGDFGFSKQLELNSSEDRDKLKMRTTVGTPLYMSL